MTELEQAIELLEKLSLEEKNELLEKLVGPVGFLPEPILAPPQFLSFMALWYRRCFDISSSFFKSFRKKCGSCNGL